MKDTKETEALKGEEWEKNINGAVKKDEEMVERETWSGKLDFVMSALSFAVGMGNMWRFPYLVYKNGGGDFLIPYVFMMVFTGFPLMFLELSFGQWGRLGIVSIWRKACPLFEGIGWSMFVVSLVTSVYYNMLNAWAVFYIAASFASDVPWRRCGNAWNTEHCGEPHIIRAQSNCTTYNGTWYNMTCWFEDQTEPDVYNNVQHLANISGAVDIKSPSDEYFHNYMLDISSDISEPGQLRWQLALCLLLMWIIVFVCLSKGIKSSGKATYVTSLFPYIILIILFGRGITLEGAGQGIIYYLKPDWKRLASATVWKDAAVQVFFSLSTCWGGLITLASYNKPNNNCFRDSIIVSLGDCLTSIFGGIVIFSFIGYMAHVLQAPIDSVATQGAGLAYIVYPEAVTTLPLSQLWAVLFMLMLINVGVGTQFTLVSTVQTCLMDVYPKQLRVGHRPTLLLLFICVVLYIAGLNICTQGGMYVLQLMDNYSATYGLVTVGIFICIALGWVYGAKQLAENTDTMFGYKAGSFFATCWKFITPAILLFILLFTFVDFKRSSYDEGVFPLWADAIGWAITLLEIGSIFFFIVYKLCTTRHKGTFTQKLLYLTRTQPGWGPQKNMDLSYQLKPIYHESCAV